MLKMATYILLWLLFTSCAQHSFDKNKQKITSELMTFGLLTQAWYRAPVEMLGGENKAMVSQDDLSKITHYIYENAEKNMITSSLGIYTFNISDVDNFISINCQSLKYPDLVLGVIVDISAGFEDVILIEN